MKTTRLYQLLRGTVFLGWALAAAPCTAADGAAAAGEALPGKLEAISRWLEVGRAGGNAAARAGGGGTPCADCGRGGLRCEEDGEGRLGNEDCPIDDGTFVETWSFDLADSSRISISLKSSEFDPFLFITDGNCLILGFNDDCGGGAGDSCLSLELPPGGYFVGANTAALGQSGAYSIQFSCEAGKSFLRGDCNGDGDTSGVTDAIVLLTFNFLGGVQVPCLAACDVNADGDTSGVTDAIVLLTFNFLGGVSVPPPFPACGPSALPSDEELGCQEAPADCPQS